VARERAASNEIQRAGREMKVSYVAASVSRRAGGVFDATLGLAQAVARLGHEVNVVGVSDEATSNDAWRWQPVNLSTCEPVGPRAFGYAPHIAGVIRATTPDVIHSHGLWMYTSLVSKHVAMSCRVPYVVTPHGMLEEWAMRNSIVKKRIAYWAYERRNLRKASCIHALCEAEATSIRKLGFRNPVCVIPNGVQPTSGKVGDSLSWISERVRGKRILLYLGRLHPKKGLHLLLQAWAQVDPATWHLVIAGWSQGGFEQQLRSQARNLGLEDSVSFVGPQFDAQKVATFAAAHAFVLPSYSEGLPMVVLEAWERQLPVLLTHACNLATGVERGAALCVNTTVDDLARGLKSLLTMSDSARSAMGAAGQRLVQGVYHWDHVAQSMDSVYRWLRGDGQKPVSVHLD
jgi:glycosyltransferase involved in cell wall biosynthesis